MQESNLFYKATRQLTQARNESEIIQCFMDAVSELNSVSALFKVKENYLTLISIQDPKNPSAYSTTQGITLPLQKIVHNLTKNHMILVENLAQPTEFDNLLSFFYRRGCRSAALFAVFEGEKLAKIFGLGQHEEVPLNMTGLKAYADLVEILGTTIQRINLLHAMDKKLADLQISVDINKLISIDTNIKTLYSNLHQQISQLLGSDLGFMIALFNPKTGLIEIPYAYEGNEHILIDPFPIGEGLTSILFRDHKPILLKKDIERKAQELGAKSLGRMSKSWMGVPLICEGVIQGALIIQDPNREERFSETDLELLTTLAPQVAIAIRNAQILSEIHQTLDTYSQERYLLNSLLDNTPDHIYFKDLQGQFIRTSNSYARTLHLNSSEDLIGKSDQHIYGGDYAFLSLKEQQAFLEANQGSSGKLERIVDTEGVEHWYLITKIPVKNNAGESIGLLGIQQDMTHFKQAEELLARHAAQLRTSAEIARDIAGTLELNELLLKSVKLVRERFGFYQSSIFLLDPAGHYAIMRESTGEAGERMKSAGHRLAVGSRSIIGTATSTGKPVIVNDVMQCPIYSPNPLLPETHSEMALPLKLSDRIIGAVDLQSTKVNAFTPDDVAVLQILADQIAVAIDNARSYEIAQKAVVEMLKVDRLKSQFLANMSHELRTPLNSIIGFSRVILKGIDGPINDFQKQDLGAIYNSGQHLLALITDILDFSKLEAGKMELQIAEVNISDLINSAMSTAVGLVKDKPIKLNHVVPTNLPAAMADATRVRQVLINLVSNAAKFTDEGSITIEAVGSVSQSGKPEIIVTVTDTGVGIAEEDQGKLFQPFSQVDDSPTRKTGGTGLGLSICKSLIEMHGGQIGLLNSELGKGSTFFFTLPLSAPEP